MSKRAKERALKAYPKSEKYTTSQRLIINDLRDGFIQGYEQAEKDLALTWEDIERLDIMLCGIKANKNGAFTFRKLSDEQYSEVLQRFNERKEERK